MEGVRAPRDAAQQGTDRRWGKFAPLDAHTLAISARHIRLEHGGFLARPRVREQGDFKSAVGSNRHRCLDVGTADAQIGQPAVSFGEGMRHESDREIDLNSFAPAVIHELWFHGELARPIRKSVQLTRDISYSCAPVLRGRARSQRMFSTASPIGDCSKGRKASPLPVRYVNLVSARALQRITDRRTARSDE